MTAAETQIECSDHDHVARLQLSILRLLKPSTYLGETLANQHYSLLDTS